MLGFLPGSLRKGKVDDWRRDPEGRKMGAAPGRESPWGAISPKAVLDRLSFFLATARKGLDLTVGIF
jgi:hypothetical protein